MKGYAQFPLTEIGQRKDASTTFELASSSLHFVFTFSSNRWLVNLDGFFIYS